MSKENKDNMLKAAETSLLKVYIFWCFLCCFWIYIILVPNRLKKHPCSSINKKKKVLCFFLFNKKMTCLLKTDAICVIKIIFFFFLLLSVKSVFSLPSCTHLLVQCLGVCHWTKKCPVQIQTCTWMFNASNFILN